MKTKEISRNYCLDNFKAILILFVVLGHVILNLNHGVELSMLHQFIYIFHMPCFVFVSGYFAKSVVKEGRFRVERVFSMLWLYILFQFAWFALEYISCGEAELDLLDAVSAPWYLLAMAIWYLLVPVLRAFPKQYVIPITIFIGVYSGYCNWFTTYLSLSRVLVFLPFFTIGLLLEKEQMEAFTNKNLRVPAICLLLTIVLVFVFLYENIWYFASLYYGEYPYAQLMNEELLPYGAVVRIIVFVFAGLIGLCLLAIVPKKKTFFSYVGENTLAVYVLHVLLRNWLKYIGIFDRINDTYSQTQMLWVVPIGIIVTLFLGNPLFGRLFKFLSNPSLLFMSVMMIGVLTGCHNNDNQEVEKIKIACVGDSITFRHGFEDAPENNYPTVLQELLGEGYEVKNFGESGTCVQVETDCAYMEQTVYQESLLYDADILILMLGTNDSKAWNWKGEAAYKEAYIHLLEQYTQKETSPKVYIGISPKAYYINDKTSGSAEFGIEPENVDKIIKIQKEIADYYGYEVIDIYEATSEHPEWLETDGIHPTLEGAKGIAEVIKEAIKNEKEK